METYLTNYATAVKWCNNSLILCNDIANVDPSIIDNCRFNFFYYEDEDGNRYESESDAPDNTELYERSVDIYQYYLTNCTMSDVDYLEQTFGLKFSYSDMLDLFVLCVDHWGTSWDYVTIETTNKYAARNLGETK